MNDKKAALDLYIKKSKYTNLYISFEEFKDLILNESFFLDEDCLFIFKKINGLHKLYFLIQDASDIKKVDPYLKNIRTEVVIDFLSKSNEINIPFEEVGFKLYKVFSRYSVLQPERVVSKRKVTGVELATPSDVVAVESLIKSVFDPKCDYMPTIEELMLFVERKELFVQKREDALLGFALYIKEAYGVDFRLNCVNPAYQSGMIGYKFVQALPKEGKKFICWADDNNSAAIRLNESIGFKKDGLKNFIYER